MGLLTMLCGLLLARANGLYIPEGCWIVFAIACCFNVFSAILKADNKE